VIDDTLTLVGAGTTVTAALPDTAPTLAITVPLPVVLELAVKLVDVPESGETLPGVPAPTDQVALETSTALPYASEPEAVNDCVPPSVTVADAGETLMVASGPALTVSVCDPGL
jgi:hypothetical protein